MAGLEDHSMTYTQPELFDDEWAIDEIAAQPDPHAAADTTVAIAAARVRARRKAALHVLDGGAQ
jgi:hypothetical protein